MKTRKKLNLNKATVVNLENVLGGGRPPISRNPKKCETMLADCQVSVAIICLTHDAECI